MISVNYPRLSRVIAGAIPVAMLGLLSACVTPPPRTYAVPAPPPQRVFVYPAHGQSPDQTERDRYECHNWAVQQTGVDPSRADASAYERVIVQPSTPPGANTAGGAIAGAIIGSIIAGPRNAGAGLVLGGVTGAVVGSARTPMRSSRRGKRSSKSTRAPLKGAPGPMPIGARLAPV